jgi:hypothetical protein
MKPYSRRRCVAGIVAVAAVTAACAAQRPAASPQPSRPDPSSAMTPPPVAPRITCATLPIVSASSGTLGQHGWQELPPLQQGVRAVAVQSSSNAWAVGAPLPDVRPEKAIVAHWNGAAWTTFSPAGLPQLSALHAVAEFPGGAWAVGESGLTDHGDGGGSPKHLLVRLTGTTMRRAPIPGPADGALEDVAATSAANAWAVGYIGGVSGGSSLILHWNGVAWERSPLPATVGLHGNIGDIGAVDATSATNAWAVGYLPAILHWNGRRWDQVASPDVGMPYALFDVATTSARNVWAVGSPKDSYKEALLLHWNGRRWTCVLSRQIDPPKYPDTYLAAVSASSADNAWAVGGYFDTAHRALALHWNGHTWKQVMTPRLGPVASLADAAFIPPSGRVWAVNDAETATLILAWNGVGWR